MAGATPSEQSIRKEVQKTRDDYWTGSYLADNPLHLMYLFGIDAQEYEVALLKNTHVVLLDVMGQDIPTRARFLETYERVRKARDAMAEP